MGRRPALASLRSRPPFGGNFPPAQEQRRGTRNGCRVSHGKNRCQGYRYHGKRGLTFIGTSGLCDTTPLALKAGMLPRIPIKQVGAVAEYGIEQRPVIVTMVGVIASL